MATSVDGGARRARMNVAPVNRDFRVLPSRLARAKRAALRLILVLAVLSTVAGTPWVFVPFDHGLSAVHWVSLVLGALVVVAAIITWRIAAAARWWKGQNSSVIHITNDEVVIRGSIRVPTNVIAGVWVYEHRAVSVLGRPLVIGRWLGELGASTAQLTILVTTLAPIIDSHHHVRRFHKGEEVAGRIEIPIGAYLDDPHTTDEILDAFARAVTPGRPVTRLASAADYGLAWSGVPSRIRMDSPRSTEGTQHRTN